MNQAKDGDTVKVHCTGRLGDGEIIFSSKIDQPLQITIGMGKFLPGIENGIIGMEIGDEKAVEIPPEEAFGLRRDELVVEVSKKNLPKDIIPNIGQQLQMRKPDGNQINLTITEMSLDTITLDANHPLAGHTLFFEIELLEIG